MGLYQAKMPGSDSLLASETLQSLIAPEIQLTFMVSTQKSGLRVSPTSSFFSTAPDLKEDAIRREVTSRSTNRTGPRHRTV